jgi:hypothetical protein
VTPSAARPYAEWDTIANLGISAPFQPPCTQQCSPSIVQRYGHADHPLIRFTHAYLYEDGRDLCTSSPAAASWLREQGEDHAAGIDLPAGIYSAHRAVEVRAVFEQGSGHGRSGRRVSDVLQALPPVLGPERVAWLAAPACLRLRPSSLKSQDPQRGTGAGPRCLQHRGVPASATRRSLPPLDHHDIVQPWAHRSRAGKPGQVVPGVIDRPRSGGASGGCGRRRPLSNLADGVVKVSLPLVAVTLANSPALVAGIVIAVTLPWLLFALPAGALTDRVDRRAAMLVANVARASALVVLVATVLLGYGSIWALYVVALFVGTAETLYDTCAQSILPQVVPREQLSRANGRLQAAELTANEFVGPPLGGVLVAIGSRWPSRRRRDSGPPRSACCCSCRASFGSRASIAPRSAPTSPKGCDSCGVTGCCAPWPP